MDILQQSLNANQPQTPYNIIFYVFLFILVVFFFNTFTNVNLSFVFGVVIACIFIYILIKKRDKNIDNFFVSTEIKLASLVDDQDDQPVFFYKDANIINLFYSITDYKNYNYTLYKQMITIVDNILKIKNDVQIGVKDSELDIDNAIYLYSNVMEMSKQFELSLPKHTLLGDNNPLFVNTLNLYLKRNIDEMINEVKNKDINYNTNFFTHWNIWKPSEPFIKN